MNTEERKINKIEFSKLKDLSLINIGKFLDKQNVDLIGYSRLENFDLLKLYDLAKQGDSPSFSLLLQFCVLNAKTSILREQALDTLKLLSMNIDGKVDNLASYYYSASLLRTESIGEGLNILKSLSDKGFPPAQCKWAIVNWYGQHGQVKNLNIVRSLLKAASDAGHIRGRLFFTRFRMRHGSFYEKLFSPFYVIAGSIYSLRKRNLPVYHEKMLF